MTLEMYKTVNQLKHQQFIQIITDYKVRRQSALKRKLNKEKLLSKQLRNMSYLPVLNKLLRQLKMDKR